MLRPCASWPCGPCHFQILQGCRHGWRSGIFLRTFLAHEKAYIA